MAPEAVTKRGQRSRARFPRTRFAHGRWCADHGGDHDAAVAFSPAVGVGTWCAERIEHPLSLQSSREQTHYDSLFRGALRMVLEEQQRLVDEGHQTPLLMVLDEAATVGSLDELDQMAATVSGLDVTLVTVVQDFSQLDARWGPRAATIVNNHSTRIVLAGLSDSSVTRYLPELVERVKDRPALVIRRRMKGTAQVVAGGAPVFVVRLKPWWRQRRLRSRGKSN